MSAAAVAIVSFAIVIVVMLGELARSRRNERRLLARGAVEPEDPVYKTMQWAYPGVFAAMAFEGAIAGAAPGSVAAAGAAVLVAAKALKFWAIAALGPRWTYRVLVVPEEPLVTNGPYRLMRHPNYVAVVGELVGMALLTGARVTGVVGTAFFLLLLYRRVQSEEHALHRRVGRA